MAKGWSALPIAVASFSSMRVGCTVHWESSSTPCWALESPRILVSKNDSVPDPAWGKDREEYWWAIANPDGTPRPAYTRIRAARASGLLS